MEKKDSSRPEGRPPEYKEALKRASALCSGQERSAGDIREKLKAWNVSEADSERIINYLYREKFLDDSRFAGMYARDKFRFNVWGKIKISHMLRLKGIDENAISEALDQFDDEEYFQACKKLILNKAASLKDKNQFTRKGKLFRYAAGHGFESELIHRVLNQSG